MYKSGWFGEVKLRLRKNKQKKIMCSFKTCLCVHKVNNTYIK